MHVLASQVVAGGVINPGTSIGGVVWGLIFAFACYKIAETKGRSPIVWGILGFFFSLITLIVVLVVPRRR
ncbi:MAG: hypothetical protein ACRYG2_16945 [Janthinobacterium lividum]